MTEYYIPTQAAQAEFTEKRSRFIGHIWRVESEAQARAHIEEMKKRFYDARHNCWCFRLHDGGVERYSDDGEPQGTAGQPMLNVFQREKVEDVCCVVTRYFGGVLLGAGGLVRAYTQGAKDALNAAGISVVQPWVRVEQSFSYSLLELVKLEVGAMEGLVGDVQYAADVTLCALLPMGKAESFTARITELTAGSVVPKVTGELWKDVPMKG